MTAQQIFEEFLKDPLLSEKGYFQEGHTKNISIVETSSEKLIEVIKDAILQNKNNVDKQKIAINLNKLLNQK